MHIWSQGIQIRLVKKARQVGIVSHAIMMGHNVWMHINAVQEANRQYDAGVLPAMLVEEQFDRLYFRDVVNEIFATDPKR